jgi:hypothetical protein
MQLLSKIQREGFTDADIAIPSQGLFAISALAFLLCSLSLVHNF